MSNDDFKSPAPRRRIQFGLWELFVAVSAVAVFLALWNQVGWLAPWFAPALACCAAAFLFRRAWVHWLLAAFASLFLGVLFLPAVQSRGPAPMSMCRNNLKQLGLALYNYHEHFGCYPPAYVADAQGRPMHSWRALLLPFFEGGDLATKYRFDEPWDGPNNRRLHHTVPILLQCPSRTDRRNTSDYLAVMGPGTMWPGSEPFRAEQITDDPSQTIMLVEVANSDVIWCEPRDLHISQMSPRVNPRQGQGISSHHAERALVVMSDASAVTLYDTITPENLRALLSPSGGEAIDWHGMDQP
ncbi:MAG: DUF1559 domain-containing protein [Pirellulales bacterium]|nr:DUF1559 domain-containing protein [Pirellulales bacterium]